MNTLRRIRRLATPEGRERLRARVLGERPDPLAQRALNEFEQQKIAFARRIAELGYAGEVDRYYWYHTVDLPGGLTTPGAYDYRGMLNTFSFAADMSGMHVLDVGSATGFFAFEFERRGAMVTSTELASTSSWDVFPGELSEQRIAIHEELIQNHTDGPFMFCRKLLGSKVERRYGRIYDFSPEVLGRSDYDLVFIGDVLIHTINPLQALTTAAQFCRGTLVIAQEIAAEPPNAQPALHYIGGDMPGKDKFFASWWLPNFSWFVQILRRLRFRDVRVVGRNVGYFRPDGWRYDRTVIHAVR
jgi:2-polyprenyl-3-methyl-5-hydroxy-6-metoxy-1,4-benzoquinol methylase